MTYIIQLGASNPFAEGYTEPLPVMWLHIDDPNFIGQMTTFEITNYQYCQFLNGALTTGDITLDANDVIGANGSNSGADFVAETYYDLTGSGLDYDGVANGGAARINYNGVEFNVDSGFENHPVTYVSCYGATAFCNYYGYRLPTEWEWQAVADFDGTYNYGCGTSINNSIANYVGSIHPEGTSIVGSFGAYGYGMAGNAWEWTSSVNGTARVFRGGRWGSSAADCEIAYFDSALPAFNDYNSGFRVCR